MKTKLRKRREAVEHIPRVLGLGAGVQPTAIILMMERGVLPKADVALFADTGWEPQAVYKHLRWLEHTVKSIPIVRVSKGNIRDDILTAQSEGRFAPIPFFTKTIDENGKTKTGIMRRQCTNEYKIQPMDRYIRREILGLLPGYPAPKNARVEIWFGISNDERGRIRNPNLHWKRYFYPFCNDPADFFANPITRSDCIDWLVDNYPRRHVPRSACLGCPYHSDSEWLAIKAVPKEWEDVTSFDSAIRKPHRFRGEAYLHRSLRPLSEFQPRKPQSDAVDPQDIECEIEGMCGY